MSHRGINKVILIGHLGQDPEVRHTSGGAIVTNLTLATSEGWRDRQTGELRERTEWHRVVMFGKLAEIAGEYLHKGSQVYLEGTLQTRRWTDQSGQDRYVTEIVVGIGGTMQMLGGAPRVQVDQQNVSDAWDQAGRERTTAGRLDSPAEMSAAQGAAEFNDDIPF